MTFADIFPREYLPALKWLGRLDNQKWVEIKRDGELRTSLQIQFDYIKEQKGFSEHQTILTKLLFRTPQEPGSMLFLCWVDAFAAALSKGPKFFQPTEEQFESMAHVDLNIPIADYRQPYPSVVVKIPNGCRAKFAKEVGMEPNECPTWLMVRQRLTSEQANFIFIGHTFHNYQDHPDVTIVYQDRPCFTSMEQALQLRADQVKMERLDRQDTTISKYYQPNNFAELTSRAALNLMLMLTHYGSKLGDPLHPKQYNKHRSDKKLEHLCSADFRTIDMVQNVVVRRVEKPGHGEESISTGRELPPHWRRGHWRNQHFGPGNLKLKMIFINPVLVRSDRAVGDLGDTQAQYQLTGV